MTMYDVIVVGGGPGGYVAAIRAAKIGKKTAIVEADLLGGTCLNRGCIPSKTLLKHAEMIEQMKKAEAWGIHTKPPTFDWSKMLFRKDKVMQTLRHGIEGLLQVGEIDVYNGFAKVLADKRVVIDDNTELKGEKIIIATGSRPVVPPIHGLDHVDYHTTDSIFEIDHIPESLVIVGGGVIGVEIAEIFSSLHVKVTIIELSERIIATEDEAASKFLLKSLKKKGIKVLLKHQVKGVHENNSKIEVQAQDKQNQETTITAENLLIAVGRSPNTEVVDALDLDRDGPFIKTNDYLETSENGVFAIGDVIGKLQLAHVASSEGLTAVANLDSHEIKMDYSTMPRCIYTSPQIASVGMTEIELKRKGISYRSHSINFSGNGMALATGETEGFTKILIDEKYGEILGVIMVGAHVTEMISQLSAFMYLEGTVDELATMVQPHPSLSEALMESANALLGKGIHTR